MLYSWVLLTKYQIFRIGFQATLKENVMKGPDIGKIHLKFLRFDLEIVGIQIHIWNILYSILIFRMFRFWFKMVLSENCILRAFYECLYHMCENTRKYCSNWLSFIKEHIHFWGLGYIWNDMNFLNIHVCMLSNYKTKNKRSLYSKHAK